MFDNDNFQNDIKTYKKELFIHKLMEGAGIELHAASNGKPQQS